MRASTLLSLPLLLAAGLASACFNPELTDPAGGYKCSGDPDCPPHQKCGADKTCVDRVPADKGPGPEGGWLDQRIIREQGTHKKDQGIAYADGPAKCNNGRLEHGEKCDKTLFGGADCTEYNNNTGGYLLCVACTSISDKYCYKLEHAKKDVATLHKDSKAAPRAAYNAHGGGRIMVTWADAHSKANVIDNLYVQALGTKLLTPMISGGAVNLTDLGAYYQQAPDMATMDKRVVLAWDDGRDLKNKINKVYATPVDLAGTASVKRGAKVNPNGAGAQNRPAIACRQAGTEWSCLVVWSDLTNPAAPRIHGMKLTAKASWFTLSAKSVLISNQQGTHQDYQPAIATDGQDYLVVWRTSPDGGGSMIYGRQVYGSGVLSGSYGSPISYSGAKASYRPDVAFVKGQTSYDHKYMVVWEDNRKANTAIYGARVTADKYGLKSTDKGGFVLANSKKLDINPRVACAGKMCVLVYGEGDTRDEQTAVKAVRFEDRGIHLSVWDRAPANPPFTIASSYRAANPVALALNSATFAIVWRQQPAKDKAQAIKAALLTP